MPNPDFSTVTDEQLCRTAEMAGDPLMWELAGRFRQASADKARIGRLQREVKAWRKAWDQDDLRCDEPFPQLVKDIGEAWSDCDANKDLAKGAGDGA